jgi:hypothetical protein
MRSGESLSTFFSFSDPRLFNKELPSTQLSAALHLFTSGLCVADMGVSTSASAMSSCGGLSIAADWSCECLLGSPFRIPFEVPSEVHSDIHEEFPDNWESAGEGSCPLSEGDGSSVAMDGVDGNRSSVAGSPSPFSSALLMSAVLGSSPGDSC